MLSQPQRRSIRGGGAYAWDPWLCSGCHFGLLSKMLPPS